VSPFGRTCREIRGSWAWATAATTDREEHRREPSRCGLIGRRDERDPPVTLGIEVAPRHETNLLGGDRAHPVDVGQLLRETPDRLGAAVETGAALGGLALEGMFRFGQRDGPLELRFGHPLLAHSLDLSHDLGLGTGEVRRLELSGHRDRARRLQRRVIGPDGIHEPEPLAQ
jgi:hypothetical protein